jgi:dephospho-CoA kinase
MKKVIGIAGYIASGKSVLLDFFRERGAICIDADEIVSGLYEKGRDGYLKILNFYGENFLDEKGRVDRQKITDEIFNDVNKIKILNNMIHPLVCNEISGMIHRMKEDLVFIEASYFEGKYLGGLVDEIIWVNCDKEIIAERVEKNYRFKHEELENILRMQSKPDKIKYTISNNGKISEFLVQAEELWKKLLIEKH